MKTYFRNICIIFLLFTVIVFPVAGQVTDQKESVVLPKDQVVNENYFAVGESVVVSGTVNGDAYVAGGNVYVDGTINGDLLVAGGTVTITGTVTGDVRAAGGQVSINGTVDRNVTVGGGNVTFGNNAKVGESIVAGAGQLSILSPVGKSVTFGAGNALLGSTINGNVLAGVGEMTLASNAVIQGNLKYFADDPAQIQQGATVSGTINYQQNKVTKKDREEKQEQVQNALQSANIAYKLYSLAVAFMLGWILLSLAPLFVKKTTELIDKNPLGMMGLGLLALIGIPIFVIILMITVVGIPLAFILMALYAIYLYLAKIVVGFYLGMKITGWLQWKTAPLLSLFIGLVAWIFLTSIPVIGWLIQFVVFITGMGALFSAKKYYFETLRAKKLL